MSDAIRMNRREILVGLATGGVVAFAPGCAQNTALGRSQLMLVSPQQISQLSQQAWRSALQEEPISRDPALNERVRRVGRQITPVTGLRENWEYVVFDSDTENAWVLPGGKVAFYRGLLETMYNDDEVAVVMGHEAAHIAGRHAAERASQQMAAGVGLGLANVAIAESGSENAELWAGVLGAGVTFGVILPYSRQHELEADRLGVDYMHRAGYRPSAAVDFWGRKAAQGGRRQPELLSTHPSDDTRLRLLRQHIAQQGYA